MDKPLHWLQGLSALLFLNITIMAAATAAAVIVGSLGDLARQLLVLEKKQNPSHFDWSIQISSMSRAATPNSYVQRKKWC